MAGSRADKSTIPQAKDPFAGVTYQQPTPAPKISGPPINSLIADTTEAATPAVEPAKRPELKPQKPPAPEPEVAKGKITVVVPVDLLERLRNAAWWKRTTLAAVAEEGIQQVLAKLERENGGPFEPREDELRPGRPQGSKSHATRGR